MLLLFINSTQLFLDSKNNYHLFFVFKTVLIYASISNNEATESKTK